MNCIKKPTVNFIGAGHVGQTLGHLLVKHHCIQIRGVCNTSEISAKHAVRFMGAGCACSNISQLPPADMVFITTPDDQIARMSEALSKQKELTIPSIVLHCSGALTSDVLSAIKEKGSYVASVHPMRSFAKPELAITQYQGTFCAMEGDPEALAVLKSLFGAIGSRAYEIPKAHKTLYHAAGVFASNYLVTLFEQARLCLEKTGIEQGIAKTIVMDLMRNTIANLEDTVSAEQALTGPVKRGDISTINAHLQALPSKDQQILYALLGKATTALTTHDEATQTTLQGIFDLPITSLKSNERQK